MHKTHLRFLFGYFAALCMVVSTAGCDKRNAPGDEGRLTSLAGKPRMLMFVFGDKADPRALPIATLTDGKIVPIELDSSGWHNFDKLYFVAKTPLSLYADGHSAGTATVRRGMWDEKPPLYKLPSCRALRPLAALSLSGMKSTPVMLEMLATSDPLIDPPARAATIPADRDSARTFAIRVSQREGVTNAARLELDEVLNVFNTGATPHPTLVGSYIERGSGVNGKPRQVLMIGDYAEASLSYAQSFVHIPGDSVREFRRYIDHADLTGDGVDEIVLEGWHKGGDSYLIFLSFQAGHWREIARGASSWCAVADQP